MRTAAFAVTLTLCSGAFWVGCSSEDASSGSLGQGENAAPDSALPSGSLESRIQQGDDIYQRGEYDSARVILESALARARSAADSSAEARILTGLGLIAYRQSDYGDARLLQEHALAIKLAIDLADELWKSDNALGLIAWNESRLSDAADFFDKAAEHAPSEKDPGSVAVISINRGLVHTDLGNFAVARASFEEAREISAAHAETRLEGIALNNLGMLRVWVGDPLTAIEALDQAMPLYRSVDFVPGELNALGQLGTAYTALGEIGKAITVLDSALELSRDRGMRQEEASNLEALAEAYRTAGDFRRALDLYERAERINEEVGLEQETGSDQRSRAEIYAELGETEVALRFASQALETHASVEARWEELADLVLLADLTHQVGDTTAARRYLSEAGALAREFDARTARVDVVLAEARIADRDGDDRRVLRVLAASREDLTAGGYDTEWESETFRARAFHGIGELDSAIAAGRRGVSAVERVRTGFSSGVLRTAYASKRIEAYSILVRSLVEAGDTGAAFEAADASRGRALLEHLTATQLDDARSGDAAAVLEEGEEILLKISELSARLREFDELMVSERDSANYVDLSGQLARARDEYEASRVRAIEWDRAGVAMLGARTSNAREVQTAVRPDEVLFEYFMTPERLLGFVVTPDGVHSFEREITSQNIARRVRIVRDLMADGEADRRPLSTMLEGLHEMLVAPAAKYLTSARRIIVVPHGVLHYLPFAALPDRNSGRYLVEDYALQYLPAASMLPVLRNPANLRDVPDERTPGGTAFAPFTRSLPATRAEVRAFRESVSNARTVEGGRATEARLRAALGEAQVVHVATHGAMNVRNPMFSRIDLASGRTNDARDDGRLEVHEVLTLSIASPLVFLSGCETGVGAAGTTEFTQGEDYATLARAFLYAGAHNVVATLWQVEDEGAAEFAKQFYRALSDSDPVHALATAQRALLADGRYGAPYYWATYQIAGAGSWGRRAGSAR